MTGMKDQYFGVEVEMTGITREQAAQALADYFGTIPQYKGGVYDAWVVKDTENKEWKLMSDGSIRAERKTLHGYEQTNNRQYKVEMVSPKLTYAELPKFQECVRQIRHGPILQDVLQTYQTLPQLKNPEFIERFWDTFALDTLLGNFDRHSGNWGFLNDSKAGELRIAPIYDCGSCLYPSLSVSKMKDILNSKDEIEKRIFDFPNSAFVDKATGKKINYAEYIENHLDNKELINSLNKVGLSFNMEKIDKVIENTPYLSDIQKEFYSTMISNRYDRLIEPFIEKQKDISAIQKYCDKIVSQNQSVLDFSKDIQNER